jgi:hypothetical protein
VQNGKEEWWECTNRACGQKIQFQMLDKVPDRSNPTCFCGGGMKRLYVKPRFTKFEVSLGSSPDAVQSTRVTIQLVDLTLHTANCLIPGPDA